MRPLLAAIIAAGVAAAQPPVAPSDEPTQSSRGENTSGYNVLQSFELGYRLNRDMGDQGMYRSTVNYTDGLRLLSGSLSVQSRDGHGHLFDQLQLNTLGLGNDPYQSAILRVEKNHLYRYDFAWRSDAYYNPGLTISYGEHQMDTVRNLQDQDLTLFPQSWLRFFLGYSRDTQSGPALSTIQLFDSTGDEFPLFTNIRRQQNEYRLGGELHLLGFRLNVLHGWEGFKEDSQQFLNTPEDGNNVNDANQLNTFLGTQPYHGSSPYWRIGLFREGRKFWAVNGRFSYVAGNRGFVLDETSSGLNRVGADTLRQVNTFGNAQRPAATGNLTISLFPASMVTITNQSSIYNIRMSGDSFYEQFTNGSPITPILYFNYLGIRTLSNSTDVQIRPWRWFSVHGGYTYDDRRISSAADTAFVTVGLPQPATIDQSNVLHAGTLGFRIKPLKAVTISLDGDVGHANKPIEAISEKNYHAFRARGEYKLRNLRVSAYGRSDYNTNSVSLSTFASHSRQYGMDASWVASNWFSIDAGYSKLHLDTLGGLSYFVKTALIKGTDSYYVSNLHTATLAARFSIRKRADVSVGYSHVQDVGDGRATATGTGAYATQPAFQAAQTFPLRFLSPQGRLSVRITGKIRWNAGYQYYGYREQFSTLQNYRAHTGYSSVAWSF